ncbi:DUF1758 domain-containing protein [Trichonephila clavipes]|nr:DUF1758 domain-containing protein [Trichonephila clavipes]
MVYGTSIKLPGEFFDPPTINMDPQNFVAKLQQHMAELKPLKSPSNRKQNIFVHKDLKSCSHVFLRIDRVKKALEPPYMKDHILYKKKDAVQEYLDDMEDAETYRDRYIEMCTRVDLKIRETVVPTETEKRSFELPKIELKKFSGEAKGFLTFWSQFQKIHNDKSIAEEDKMQYLLQSMKPKSKAERLVLSFPATAENYPKAIDQLKERFGREDLLVQIYVRELLNLVMKNAVSGRTKTDLSALYDELEGKLRSLESLGRTQEKYGDFLTPLVESCLPEEILMVWERKRNTETDAKGS